MIPVRACHGMQSVFFGLRSLGFKVWDVLSRLSGLGCRV